MEELAALAAAGFADPPPEDVTIEEDAEERDQFIASLATPAEDNKALPDDPLQPRDD